MNFILVLVVLTGGSAEVSILDATPMRMDECFDRRDKVIEMLGRPIKNYQVVCITK